MKNWATTIPFLAISGCVSAANPSDPSLIGCWHSGVVTSYLSDGTARESNARCTLVFSSTSIVSTCIGSAGPFSITYSYTIVALGEYEAEITAHSRLPGAIGSKRRYDYRVQSDNLLITTYPQTTSPAPLNAAVKVVSTSTRDEGSCMLGQ